MEGKLGSDRESLHTGCIDDDMDNKAITEFTTMSDKENLDTNSSDKLQDKRSSLQNLTELGTEPAWRGSVDGFVDWNLRGWVISTTNVFAAVEVDIFICDINVATTSSRHRREDINRALKNPVYAGFQIGIQAINAEAAVKVLDKLRSTSEHIQRLENIVSVKITGTDIVLPFSKKGRDESIFVDDLLDILNGIIGLRIKNEYIDIRDNLLLPSSINENKNNVVKTIAFYLPQFHPFPENNEWWGEGFTEWTNVVGAKPFFSEHYQPHIPADFGYYDLRVKDVQISQINLAKRYQITGFCYYYYWFSGKSLMTMPIDRHLDENLDLDFCLCWANENWSRRWDGSDTDVLIAQRHVEEEDVSFIESCLKFFRSDRYIKIDGAPLLLIYRVSLLCNPKDLIMRWRNIVRENGFPDLHVCMIESFGLQDPFVYGCDSSCQFPPHGLVVPPINDSIPDLDHTFKGKIYDYRDVVRTEIARPVARNVQFRCAMPSWDNTSRKGTQGNIFAYSSPDLFEAWLSHLVYEAKINLPSNSRFVFINAWNEWAEGAHLEPDRQSAHKNLQAVRSALSDDSATMEVIKKIPDDATFGDLNFDDLKMLVNKLQNSNQQLKRVIQRYSGPINDRASPFVQVNQKWISAENKDIRGKLVIENINGRISHDTKLVILSSLQNLSLRGWICADDVELDKDRPIFVSLRAKEMDELRYVAAIYDRERRDDVVAALSLNPNATWCGFSFNSKIHGIMRGSYDLNIELSSRNDIKSLITISANIEVVVG